MRAREMLASPGIFRPADSSRTEYALAPGRGIEKKGNAMRQAFRVVALALLMLATALAAQAQQITLSDGNYASTGAYLEGTWKWERAEPRQTMIMRFGRDGSFYFHNFTIDLQHWGRYTASGKDLALKVTRSCEDKGNACENRNPPLDLNYTITPSSANLFLANTERWERQK
jgi:hypothetical protein